MSVEGLLDVKIINETADFMILFKSMCFLT